MAINDPKRHPRYSHWEFQEDRRPYFDQHHQQPPPVFTDEKNKKCHRILSPKKNTMEARILRLCKLIALKPNNQIDNDIDAEKEDCEKNLRELRLKYQDTPHELLERK